MTKAITARAAARPSSYKHHLLLAASLSALALASPGIAMAQLPPECAPNPATAGDTINCEPAAPGAIGPIATTVDDLTINIGANIATDVVSAPGGSGVYMTGSGSFALSLGAGSSISADRFGLRMVLGAGSSGPLTITSAGTISGSTAISATNLGSGALAITSNNAYGGAGYENDGIFARSYGSGMAITSTGTARGYTGIVAINYGSGALTIHSNNVTGTTGSGIAARNYNPGYSSGSPTDLTITSTGTASGAFAGISASNSGTGALTITSVDASGGTFAGISGVNGVAATDLTITSTGTASGGASGINATNNGTGALTITSVDATGGSDSGIRAINGATATDLTITSTGTAAGGNDGIYAENAGAGLTTIVSNDATGASRDGIRALVSGEGGLLIQSGTATGGFAGIIASNTGTGALTINSVDATGGSYSGIRAFNGATATDLTITSTGTAASSNNGIYAQNAGAGPTTIVSNTASGTARIGIRAFVSGEGGLAIRSGTATGGQEGISVTHSGTGMLAIESDNASGGITGIGAYHGGVGLSITSTGTASGGAYGINVFSRGSGAHVIRSNNATGGTGSGINSFVFAANGLRADQTIISTGLASGAQNGIFAGMNGAGDLTVRSNNATSSDGAGIAAGMFTLPGGNLSVTSTGAASGATVGISAINFGVGVTRVDSNNAYSDPGTAIAAIAGVYSSDIQVISRGVASGGEYGIFAQHLGDGLVTVTSNDAVGENLDAIRVRTFSVYGGESAGITISSTGTATGGRNGIYASNEGVGALTITAADTSGASGSGINASNAATATDLTIVSSGAATGGLVGISSDNRGSGALAITAAGAEGNSAGIQAINRGTSLTITSTGEVSGGSYGLFALNEGSGSLTVRSNNAVSGGTAVDAYNRASGGAMTVTSTGTASGGDIGVDAVHRGAGALTVTSHNASGTSQYGMRIGALGPNVTDLNLTSTGDASGGHTGIFAVHTGSGALRLSANNTSGETANGMLIFSGATTTGLEITTTATGAVSGGVSGIELRSFGVGAKLLNLYGDVSGGEHGVLATMGGSGLEIIVNDGATVSGGDAAIEITGETGDLLRLYAGGTINGDASLGEGDDQVDERGGVFTRLIGGDGVDTIHFSGAARSIADHGNAGDGLQEFEIFNFLNGGFDLAGLHVGLQEANFRAGINTLSGTLGALDTRIFSGAMLRAADGASILGNLTNSGILDLGDGPSTLTVSGDFTQTASGVLTVEITSSAHDAIIAGGAVSLGGTLIVDTELTGFAPGVTATTIIDGGTGLSGAFDSVFGLASGLLVDQQVVYDFTTFDVTIETSINLASSLEGLTQNQGGVGDSLVRGLSGPGLDPDTRALIQTLGRVPDAAVLGRLLDDFTPAGFDLSQHSLNILQARFLNQMIAQATGPGALEPMRLASLQGGAPLSSESDRRVWASFEGGSIDRYGSGTHLNQDGDFEQLAIGVTGLGADRVSFGLATGYSTSEGAVNGLLEDSVETSTVQAGASVRAELGGEDGWMAHVDSALAFATGETRLRMNVFNPVSGAAVIQSGETDLSRLDWTGRLTVDGRAGREWALKPHVRVGANAFGQDAVSLGDDLLALRVDDAHGLRYSLGAGASFEHAAGDRFAFGASVTAVQYFGDTRSVFSSRFSSMPATGAFITQGREVETQVEAEVGLSWTGDGGWGFDAAMFGETGDLDAVSARAALRKRF